MIPENVSVTGNNKDFSVNVPHFIHSTPSGYVLLGGDDVNEVLRNT